jgi:hypothetical protein
LWPRCNRPPVTAGRQSRPDQSSRVQSRPALGLAWPRRHHGSETSMTLLDAAPDVFDRPQADHVSPFIDAVSAGVGEPEIRPLTTVVATSSQSLNHREPCSAITPAPLQQCRRQRPPRTPTPRVSPASACLLLLRERSGLLWLVVLDSRVLTPGPHGLVWFPARLASSSSTFLPAARHRAVCSPEID